MVLQRLVVLEDLLLEEQVVLFEVVLVGLLQVQQGGLLLVVE